MVAVPAAGKLPSRRLPEGKLGDFYLKKFRGIILPALVIFFVRALYDLRADPVSLRHVVSYFVRGSLGQYSGIEYWFIFSLAKLLLAAPFLAPAFAHLSPKHMLLSFGIYIGLLSLGRRLAARGSLDGRLGSAIFFVARHSFTVYLVHLMVLMPIAYRIPGGCGMVSLAFYPLVIVLVVLLSLGVAVVLDTVLVKPCQALLDRIVSRFCARGDA